DEAGFTQTKIFASGDLDEYIIADLKSKSAKIDLWGVGTRLVTAYDQPAINMTYKLAAIRDQQQSWDYKIKISDEPGKTTIPGIHQVRRYFHQQEFKGDVIYDLDRGISEQLPSGVDQAEDLLVPIFRNGKLVYSLPSLNSIQDFCKRQLSGFLKS